MLRWLGSASLATLTSGLAPGLAGAAKESPVYRDPRAPVDLRVRDLMARMTLDEKVAQLITLSTTKRQVMDDALRFDPARADTAYPNGIGQIARPSDRGGAATAANTGAAVTGRWRAPADTIAFVNAAQRWATTRTRLGIPILFHEEALHGFMAPEATSFPQAIALAGSFDRDLVRRVNAVIAREVRAHGTVLALSPVVDIARDPRWGRIEETFGEDPYLCGEMGVASVIGLQGEGKTLAPGKVFATLKHMTGHGQPESGENVAPAPIAERELRENFFPPFRAVVARTGIGAVMPSYNEIDGVPSHANRWLLNDVLRGEWGFDGAIVSDYAAIGELASLHHIAADKAEAARLALAAGVDSDLPDGEAYRSLADQVRAGRVAIEAVDAACRRMLTLKMRSGMFEQAIVDPQAAARMTGNAEARALALEAARRSIALLVNDGVLPLTPGAHKRVAVIGPNAAVARLGGYSSIPKATVSLLEGVRARLKGKADVVHAQGVFITQSEDRSANEVLLADPARNRDLIAEAVTVASTADVILLAVGDTEQTSREGYAKTHLGDRTSLDLLGEQNALFAAMKATGKPVIVVAINGRPPSWPSVTAQANAVLECWYVGQEGGTAIAEALFGDINPGAKLPVTVARSTGQLPVFYDAKPSARRGYLFDTTAPLFPFGFGLSYTKFEIGAPRLSSAKIGIAASVTVSVDIANVGARAGDEVVQLYVRDQVSSVARPILELKGFERVTLAPGERRTVQFTLGPDAFRFFDIAMREVVEPGLFDISVGADSTRLKTVILEIA
ncbi:MULTISPECIES: glycoside hydrolase family 3 N-terminal domain-containing protein [Sphingomonas]|uniref:glycoside hydrolase family 3 N-terminal domain-containing protein n=1 Tax=Sphingomonas TaxID=13687 RepID=UPI0006FD6CFD|nr:MULTISPECIES: glycoside hydrolase family 3 N-terminal domain-containing protein [Sphingomonas]KQM91807.1 glycoside hydrolase [Sphingomonas sp. Leaf226]MDY0967028.1 glycoside hydrolase family 3 N-terminal domain-containing protein [Sphingomonas sp. CFBP9021]USR02106.1 glycoside hydrolase family 3 C-terminal domain-containing protein [Sphingomonas aerolata]